VTTLTAHFDAHVLVPDSPVSLPMNQPLSVSAVPTPHGVDHGEEVDEMAWMRAAATVAGSDSLAEELDFYLSSDGRPFVDKR
jgi:hypothetical protein